MDGTQISILAERAAFTDSHGKEWVIPPLTVADVKRVRAATGVDLWKLADAGWQSLTALLGDPEKLIDVVFHLAAKDTDPNEFAARLVGVNAIESVAAAFLRAYLDFCPSRSRPLLMALVTAGRATMHQATATATQAIEQLMTVALSGSPSSSLRQPA